MNTIDKDNEKNTFNKDKRMKDRYLLLRFIAFYLYFNKKLFKDKEPYQYASDIDEFLGLTMEYLNSLAQSEINEIEMVTAKALEQVEFYLGVNAFRLLDMDENGKLKRYPININIFESIMYAMTMIPFCRESLREEVKTKFNQMKNSQEFRNSITNHRDNAIKVAERLNIIMKIVGEINDK